MRKQLIIKNKNAGYSQLSDALVMNIPVDTIVTLDKGMHHEVEWSLRGIPADEKMLYSVTVGRIDEETNELISVKLHRKTKEVFGQVMLGVSIVFHEMTYAEVLEEEEGMEEMYNAGLNMFADDTKTQDINDIIDDVNDLGSQL